tara:strand:- start:543 stop:2036 length:1494 start_codon:yes stop_codon:yes gene_type:complete
MVVKFNFRGTVNTLAGHKRNLANTKKRVDAVRKIQAAYRAALARRRKRAAAAAAPVAVVAKKPKQTKTKTKTKAKAKKPKTKKLVKSKVRALLKLNRPALEKKFQDVRKLAKELACSSGDRNLPLHDRRFGPKEIGKLGLTNRELVDMIRRTEQSCFGGYGISRIPTKQERKYFAGVNMSNNAKKNKNYVPNNKNNDRNNNDYLRALGWEHVPLSGLVPVNQQARNNFKKGNMTTGRIPKLPNEYIYTNDANEIKKVEENMVWNNFYRERSGWQRAKQAKPAMNDAKLRAYLRNQIKARFGVDPNKNARFVRLENWRNYGNDPNASKVYQYMHTLKQPGKLAGKKRFGRGIYKTLTENWTGATVPTTRTGRRGAVAARPGVHQRAFAKRILNDLDNEWTNNGWTKNLSENDKRYAKRMVNTHGRFSEKNKIMTNAVANNIIKRFGKRAARAMRRETNKARANNVKRFVDNRLDGNWRPITTKKGQNEWLKGMGMAGR